MNLMVLNILMGVLIIVGSFAIVRRIDKRWGKIIGSILGITLAGIITFFPWISTMLNSHRIPGDAEILSLLYGDDFLIQESLDGRNVYIVEQLSQTEREQFNHAVQVNTQIVYKKNGWNNNPHSLIVLTRTGPPDCCDRSLSPILGGAVIQLDDDAWRVSAYQKLISPFQSFDLISEGEFVEIGPGKMGLLLPERTQLNGATQTWEMILSEIDGQLKLVAKIETGANNTAQCSSSAGDEPCWAYASTYEFIPGRNPKYYDIQIRSTGTKITDDLLLPFEDTSRYIFSEDEFRFELQ